MCVSIGGLEQLGTGAWRGNGEKTSPVAKDAGEGGGGMCLRRHRQTLLAQAGIFKKSTRAFRLKLISFPTRMLKRGV